MVFAVAFCFTHDPIDTCAKKLRRLRAELQQEQAQTGQLGRANPLDLGDQSTKGEVVKACQEASGPLFAWHTGSPRQHRDVDVATEIIPQVNCVVLSIEPEIVFQVKAQSRKLMRD